MLSYSLQEDSTSRKIFKSLRRLDLNECFKALDLLNKSQSYISTSYSCCSSSCSREFDWCSSSILVCDISEICLQFAIHGCRRSLDQSVVKMLMITLDYSAQSYSDGA